MQEPEIFEQPVASKDPEAAVSALDDNHTYHTGLGSGYQQTNHTGEDSSLEDYHDFVYPEGEFLVLFLSSAFAFLAPVRQP